jgi:hypothetical protein
MRISRGEATSHPNFDYGWSPSVDAPQKKGDSTGSRAKQISSRADHSKS